MPPLTTAPLTMSMRLPEPLANSVPPLTVAPSKISTSLPDPCATIAPPRTTAPGAIKILLPEARARTVPELATLSRLRSALPVTSIRAPEPIVPLNCTSAPLTTSTTVPPAMVAPMMLSLSLITILALLPTAFTVPLLIVASSSSICAPLPDAKIMPAPKLLMKVRKCMTPKVPLWMRTVAPSPSASMVLELLSSSTAITRPPLAVDFIVPALVTVAAAFMITRPDPVPSRVPELASTPVRLMTAPFKALTIAPAPIVPN